MSGFSSTNRPRVSIITVNYNETATTCALLDNLRALKLQDTEVIVVDNASRENPGWFLQFHYPEVKFIRSEQNLGFAGGNNLALPYANGEYLFFLNNDTELAQGCLEHLLQIFENQSNIGIISPLICYYPEPPEAAERIIQYAGMTEVSPFTGRNQTIGERETDRGQYALPAQTAYAHGAAMMVPRKVLEKVGSMWEGFFLYYEELDWCERIKKAGFEVWLEPRARVWHKESHTLDKMGTTKTYFLTRNRILFMLRNRSGWNLLVFYAFLFFVTIPKHLLRYGLKGETGNLAAFLRGIGSSFGSSKARIASEDLQPMLREALHSS